MDLPAALLLLVALLIGLAVGWWLRTRSAAPLMAEKADLAAKLDTAAAQRNGAIAELAVEKERVAQAAGADEAHHRGHTHVHLEAKECVGRKARSR